MVGSSTPWAPGAWNQTLCPEASRCTEAKLPGGTGSFRESSRSQVAPDEPAGTAGLLTWPCPVCRPHFAIATLNSFLSAGVDRGVDSHALSPVPVLGLTSSLTSSYNSPTYTMSKCN